MNRRVKVIMPLFIAMTLVMTGCWSRIEVNDISIVTAMAIDKQTDGNIQIALQIPIPSRLSSSGSAGNGTEKSPSALLVSEKGSTIMDAYRRLEEKLSRRVFFSQLRFVIIGEQAARDGIQPLLDFFVRGNTSRPRSYVLFSEGQGIDMLKLSSALERYSTEVIREEEKLGTGLQVMQSEFVDMLSSKGMAAVAAKVTMRKPDPSDHRGPDSNPNNKDTPAIAGTAVIRQGKLVGWLNEEETRGLLWMKDKLKKGVITTDVPKERGGGKISVQIIKGKTKLKALLQGYNVKFVATVRTKCELLENSSQLDASNPQDLRYMGSLLEKNLEKRIQDTVDRAQKLKADIFGFGNMLYQSHPSVWNGHFKDEWASVFSQMEILTSTQVTIVRTGLTNKSIYIE
ncbi:hypothetical protein DN757_18540 [Paenibacillus silvae]|uniref:Ger(X)C family spore germination protein n=2 Tax=Paenibacillus silvae TaxID=1325358 RepID=A0A2W6QA62_9BACL|nr:hypothetical protein DN757_18540 [Paenibacillus silvae]